MKKVVVLLLTVVIMVCTVLTAFGYQSRSRKSCVPYATTVAKATGVVGQWTRNQAGEWSFSDGSRNYVSTWALIKGKDGVSRWYFFDGRGVMLTGWVWIKGADGLARCYYLDKSHTDLRGALYMNGRTPDEYYVTSSGEWFKAGKVQTR